MIYSVIGLMLMGVASAIFTGQARNSSVIDGEYIVVFHPHVNAIQRNLHMKSYTQSMDIMHEYSIGSFQGYAAKMDGALRASLMASGDVAYIEANQEVHILQEPLCVEQVSVPSWGLTRTNKVKLDLDGTYAYRQGNGKGVTIYDIDTGINVDHVDFLGEDGQSRAIWGADTASRTPEFVDGNGHGTHVAGTMVGSQYGIAKEATVIAVKVLGTNGSGSTAGVIAGVNWVAEDHQAKHRKKSVANMSLGGGKSIALEAAVNSAVDAGIVFAVAAGNENQDACKVSPAAADGPLTVASSDDRDRRSSFSNWGACADIFAPGTGITSAWIGSPTARVTISGTSMASPHVAGVAAQIWSHEKFEDYTSAEIKTHILATATKGAISQDRGTPNLLAFSDCVVV